MIAHPVSKTNTTASPQNTYSSYYQSGNPQKPAAPQQPTMIGPQGYDELK
jgi:hypothetical protein